MPIDNEQQAIEIISYLVSEYRRAFIQGGDYKSIQICRGAYCNAIKESWKLSEKDLHVIYLKGKILADEYQIDRHRKELMLLESNESCDNRTVNNKI